MKKIISLFLLIGCNYFYAQIGVNTNNPFSLLDIRSSNSASPAITDGLLLPRITSFAATNPGANQHGMMVFLSVPIGLNPVGYYYWDFPSLTWKNMGIVSNGLSGDWLLVGNGGISDATNFIGTTDNKNLILKRNNFIAGSIDIHDTGFGYDTRLPPFYDTYNTTFGVAAIKGTGLAEYNTAIGYNAITTITGGLGGYNVGIGPNTISKLGPGHYNIAIGNNALFNTSNGGSNTSIGTNSMVAGTNDSDNVAIGASAIRLLNGNDIVSVGYFSLYNSTYGYKSVAIGSNALSNSVSGYGNIGIGNNTTISNAGANNNLSIGNTIYGTDLNTVFGVTKIGVGINLPSAKLHINGELKISSLSTAANVIGAGGLRWNGTKIQFSNGTIWANVDNPTGWMLTGNSATDTSLNYYGTSDNVDVIFKRFNVRSGFIYANDTSLGVQSMPVTTTDGNNTAIGTSALFSNVNDVFNNINNTTTGYETLYSLFYGDRNAAFGAQALRTFTKGSTNTAIGRNALFAFNEGYTNTATGANSLSVLNSGEENTAFGFSALGNSTSGKSNIGFGHNAQVQNISSDKQLRFGDNAITYAGIQVAWNITSDKRWKNTIKDSNLGLNFINKLRPVSYFRNNDDTKKLEYGFIAQELQQNLNEFKVENSGIIATSNDGKLSVRYNDLLPILIKSVQERQVQINELKKEIKTLKSK